VILTGLDRIAVRHLGQEGLDGIDDLDAVLVAEGGGEAGDAVTAARQVGAAAGVGGHDADAGQLALGVGVVEHLGEGDDVRRVQADHADADRLDRLGGRGAAGKGQQHQGDHSGEDAECHVWNLPEDSTNALSGRGPREAGPHCR